LLAWDKDSYTERFLALLPCTCILQPKLIHLYQTSSLLPGHLPIVTCQFKITLLAPLQWAHQQLSSFRFPSLSVFLLFNAFCLACDPCPIILLHLFRVYNPHMRENMGFLAFWAWLTSLEMMFSSSIHLLVND
jgi:hypothetical protein